MILALCLTSFPMPAQAVGGVIDVTTTEDEYNTNADTCSLREAIQAVNSGTGFNGCSAGDTIHLVGGEVYVLTRTGSNEDSNVNGDLDVTTALTLTTHNGQRSSIEGDVSWADRLLDVQSASITVTVSQVLFANGNVLGQGGAIRNNSNATLLLTSVVFQNSTASTGGGGLANMTGGMATLTQSVLQGNSVTGAGPAGAGILNLGTLTLIQSAVINNIAQGGDGGGIATDGPLTLRNVTLSGNSAADSGGGLFIDLSGSATLNNVTITNNTANTDADVEGDGGGLQIATTQRPIISNSILAGNFDNAAAGDVYHDCATQMPFINSQGYNIFGDWTSSGTNCDFFIPVASDQVGTVTPLNPGLASLADNGSGRPTHALLSSSPAINGGNPATPTGASFTCETADQRGVARTIGACDIGAFELKLLLYLPLIQR